MPTSSALRIAVFSLVMILCASGLNAVMDTLTPGRYARSVFASLPADYQQWFNPELSFRNKWKNGEASEGPAFPLASTTFVFVTDAWHFFKWLAILCLYLAILAPFTLLFRLPWYAWLLILIGLDVLRGGAFELLHAWLLLR